MVDIDSIPKVSPKNHGKWLWCMKSKTNKKTWKTIENNQKTKFNL